MGEVYRARDTKLDRDALKVLPEAFTADPDRLARFEREAKVLASLTIPASAPSARADHLFITADPNHRGRRAVRPRESYVRTRRRFIGRRGRRPRSAAVNRCGGQRRARPRRSSLQRSTEGHGQLSETRIWTG